jgi:DNA-binding NarL/FixJ family response regulator
MRDPSSHERAAFAGERTAGNLRVLIVDDEPIARDVLREELATYPDVEVAGEASNGPEAVERIAELRPDLVLLDLQMPGFGGFDVIQRLERGALPFVVIVTAYDQHAVRASKPEPSTIC